MSEYLFVVTEDDAMALGRTEFARVWKSLGIVAWKRSLSHFVDDMPDTTHEWAVRHMPRSKLANRVVAAELRRKREGE